MTDQECTLRAAISYAPLGVRDAAYQALHDLQTELTILRAFAVASVTLAERISGRRYGIAHETHEAACRRFLSQNQEAIGLLHDEVV